VVHEAWRPLFDLSVSAWSEGNHRAGERACEALLDRNDLPDHIRDLTAQNINHYARMLEESAPSLRIHRLLVPVEAGRSRFNPSIAPTPDGFAVLVRSANYWFGYRVPQEVDSVGRSAIVMADLDRDLAVRRSTILADRSDPGLRYSTEVQGFEDGRLVEWNGGWHAIATARDRAPDDLYRVCLLRIEDDAIVDTVTLGDAAPARSERNWTPVVAGGDLLLIYSFAPTVILRYDPMTRAVEEVDRHAAPPAARSWRGGTQAIPFDGGYLTVAHETSYLDGPWRRYRHRWVLLDRSLRIVARSPQFSFLYRGVEFAAGLARDGDRLLVSFGVNDREAYVASVDAGEVRAMLVPVQCDERGGA
jgi:predicted GH43/DUF377 family glycosyl hydrolase